MKAPEVSCRWCEWRRPLWSTAKGGVVRCGFESLRDHVQTAHAHEYHAICARLDDEQAVKLPHEAVA